MPVKLSVFEHCTNSCRDSTHAHLASYSLHEATMPEKHTAQTQQKNLGSKHAHPFPFLPTDVFFSCSCCTLLQLSCCLCLLAQGTIHIGVECSHPNCTPNNVTQRHRQQILQQIRAGADVSPNRHGQWDDEHVGNRVLQANRYKGRDGKVDAGNLADETVGSNGHPGGKAYEPVGQYCPQECLHNRTYGLRV